MNLILSFLYTLGHSTHHCVIHDQTNNVIFTGDSFGINYPRFGKDHTICSTTPIGFNPHQMKEGVDLIMETGAEAACLTHFGIYEDISKLYEHNHYYLDETYKNIVLKVPDLILKYDNDEKSILSTIENLLYTFLESYMAFPRKILEEDVAVQNDVFLNALGIYVYVKRTLEKGLEI